LEFRNIVARRQRDLATQVSLPHVCEDIPVVIEVGCRESQVQFELVSVGIGPRQDLPDLVCRARAKINDRPRRAAAWWPPILPYVQLEPHCRYRVAVAVSWNCLPPNA
jgi:hypothetical protein